ncbi:zinc finger protein 135-like [Oppia nitens]|uniref:zinc finger protein 135-like n=1 Tax=Oppia nitens TaxID=1686743 RepID=UPI0023DC6ABE|nr:zinc finger protein 135-like [Oppia nitens]
MTYHMNSHTGATVYRCDWPECDKSFIVKSSYVMHMGRHQGKHTYQCSWPECDYITQNTVRLKSHIMKHKDNDVVITEDNNIQTNKVKDNNKTVIKKKKKKSTTTVVKRIKSADELKAMKLFDTKKCRQPDGRTYRCPWDGCLKTYRDLSAFYKHRHLHLGTYRCPVDGCSFVGTSSVDLKIHQTVHSDDKPYECPDCGKCFSLKKLLNTHRLTKHPDAYPDISFMVCQETGCTYRTKKLSEFNRHKRRHSLPIVCPDCGKRFSSNYLLRDHQIRHQSSVKQHNCRLCGKQFKTRLYFDRHYRLYHQQMDYHCDYDGCNETFTIKHQYLKHRKIHVNDNNVDTLPPHACDWPGCDRRFKYNGELEDHMNTHTGATVYRCSWPECDKSFLSKSAIVGHMHRHEVTRQNTYQCSWPECNYSTPDTVRLMNHLIKHKGVVD